MYITYIMLIKECYTRTFKLVFIPRNEYQNIVIVSLV